MSKAKEALGKVVKLADDYVDKAQTGFMASCLKTAKQQKTMLLKNTPGLN